MEKSKKFSFRKPAAFAMLAALLVIPAGHVYADYWGTDTVAIQEQTAIITAIENQKWGQTLKEWSEQLKDYEQHIKDYKELVNQGITQAKQYKNEVEQLQELYHQGKTFVTGDLPHFMSDLKADPISTLNGYTNKLIGLAQNADQALGSLKTVKMSINGNQYSLDQLAGLSGEQWYSEVSKDGFNKDPKMDGDAEKWAGALTAEEKAFIRRKYNMSPEDYYKWYTKSLGFKKSVSSAMAACTQWSEDAKKNAAALSGYAKEVAKMGMTDKISANELAQMTNNLLLSIAQTLQPAMAALQQSQACTLQAYAVAEQGGASGTGGGGGSGGASTISAANKSYEEQEAWEEELEREDVPGWYYKGTASFPELPNRDFSGKSN